MKKNLIRSICHIVVDISMMTGEELSEFYSCVENISGPDCRGVIHLLVSEVSDSFSPMYQQRKTAFIDYNIEENVDPNVLRTQMFPYYCFDKNMEFWGKLFGSVKGSKGICYAFLSDFIWKTQNNVMWPYHLQNKQFKQARIRVTKVLDRVPDDFILSYGGIDNFYRSYLFQMKSEGSTEIKACPQALQMIRNGCIIYEAKKLEIVLTKFRPGENKIQIVAFIKSPVFNFCRKPNLWLEINGDKERRKKVPLKKSSWCYYKTKEETNLFYTFVLDIDSDKIRKFHFYVEVNDTIYDTYYYFMPEVIFNNSLGRYRYYSNDMEYRFDHNTFLVNKAPEGAAEEYQAYIQKQFEENGIDICGYRKQIAEDRKDQRKIWLYYDCKGVYKDNGYYQFIHDFDKADQVERYYVLNNDLVSCSELFEERHLSYVISFGSEKHKRLYCFASKVITAYIEKNNYLPFSQEEYAKLMDVASMPEIIYLQHGVYHANIPWKYSLDRLQLDKKVISTRFEHERDIEDHCFEEEYEIASCMPRYDFFDISLKPERKILYAPSWRKYLVDMIRGEWVTREDIFKESRFFSETKAFLQDQELIRFLRRKGYTLEFKLHPILMRYEHLYQLDGEIISMAPKTVREEDYAVFITDFSSYVYDFAYLKRSIIYFVPDYEEFRSGMNDYRECVLPFQDGLGDFANSKDTVVKFLKKSVRRGGKPSMKYVKRMNNLFFYKDSNACQRIYDTLKE